MHTHVPMFPRRAALVAALAAATLSAGCAALDDETGTEAERAVADDDGAIAPHLDPTQPPSLDDVDTTEMIVDDPADVDDIEELNVRLEAPVEQLLAQP